MESLDYENHQNNVVGALVAKASDDPINISQIMSNICIGTTIFSTGYLF